MLKKIFHFDINGTIIGTDSTDNAHLHQAVAEIIARSIKDKEEYSYYDKIKKQHPKDYKTICYNVVSDFDKYDPHDFIDNLPNNIITFTQLATKLEKIFSDGIFPSFKKFLNSNPNHAIVFRTFGFDGPEVIKQLPNLSFTHLYTKWDENKCLFLELNNDEIDITKKIFSLSPTQGLCIRDDHRKWNKHNRAAEYGKLIVSDSRLKQYGVDDNPCMYSNDTDVKIFRINTVLAALDEDYYINLFNERTNENVDE